MLTENEKSLIQRAKALAKETDIKNGIVKEVGCVLVTEKGEIFEGVSLNIPCGIGFCAEHTAISQMITQTDETHIKIIVAACAWNVSAPCGRCRELINLIDERNKETEIIVTDDKKVKLKDILPYNWEEFTGVKLK